MSDVPIILSPEESFHRLHRVVGEGTLTLLDAHIPCAVIEGPDAQPIRLLSTTRMQRAIGMRQHTYKPGMVYIGTGPVIKKDYTVEVPGILTAENLRPFLTQEAVRYCTPYWYRNVTGLKVQGYPAELLPQLCDLYLSARDAGVLTLQQQHIAERCYQLIRAFAKLAITALVDEVTGYQAYRAKDELQQLMGFQA